MAKNFPYFKFFPTEWMTGDIVFEDLDTQGLFINICALYWQRNADLNIEDINKRFKNPSQLRKLTDRFISVNEDKITIKFLDEQLEDASHISKTNSENGSKGGRPKGAKTLGKKPTANRPLTDRKAKKSKEEEELNKNNINTRILVFAETLKPYLQKYGKETITDFYKYWTEKTKSGTKFKQELEKTWSLELRLETWARNQIKFGSKKQETETPKKIIY